MARGAFGGKASEDAVNQPRQQVEDAARARSAATVERYEVFQGGHPTASISLLDEPLSAPVDLEAQPRGKPRRPHAERFERHDPRPPPATDYSSALVRVIRALLDDGREAGARALEPIAFPRREIAKRPSLGRVRAGEVFRRDRFRCRYCGVRVIPTPIMELVGNIYPDGFPYHPNWKGGLTTRRSLPSRASSTTLTRGRAAATGWRWRTWCRRAGRATRARATFHWRA